MCWGSSYSQLSAQDYDSHIQSGKQKETPWELQTGGRASGIECRELVTTAVMEELKKQKGRRVVLLILLGRILY